MARITVADTSFLVDLMRGERGATRTLDVTEEEGRPLYAFLAVVHELYRGLARTRRPIAELQRIQHALQGIHILLSDVTTTRISEDLEGALFREGIPIGPLDCQIAATALRHGYPVFTRHTRHFDRTAGLQVQTH